MIDIILWLDDRDPIKEFYGACGYHGGIQPSDSIVAAREKTGVVGVVRICPEEGFTVLRGMEVAESHRRRGIGTLLLNFGVRQIIAARRVVCWGIATRELEGFYRQGGFHFIQDDDPRIPQHLQERLARYRRENLNKRYAIMLR
jgi:GNAT superfamily N-acetyltransferase